MQKNIQGCTKRTFPGCVKFDQKVVYCLPTARRKAQYHMGGPILPKFVQQRQGREFSKLICQQGGELENMPPQGGELENMPPQGGELKNMPPWSCNNQGGELENSPPCWANIRTFAISALPFDIANSAPPPLGYQKISRPRATLCPPRAAYCRPRASSLRLYGPLAAIGSPWVT